MILFILLGFGMSDRKKKVFSGFIWRLAERFGAQGVSLVVSIILARLIDPEYHGNVAIVLIVTTIMDVFVDGGLAQALIQKKNTDELDYSSVFFFNFYLSLIIYLLTWFLTPVLAAFFNSSELTPLIRVLGLSIILNGLKNVQIAYVSKKLQYRLFFFSTLGGTLISAVVGLWMAYNGYGVWSLVAQLLTNNAIDTLILWITVEWKPRWMFSGSRLKGLFSFGWKIFFSNLFGAVCENLNQLVVGKAYSTTDLAYYNKGAHFPEITISNILPAIDGVLFPTLSEEQASIENIKSITKRGLRISNYVVFPIMAGMAVCANALIGFLLTDKWIFSVIFLQIFCLRSLVRPFVNVNFDAINAIGRSDATLKLEIVKRVLGILLLLIAIPFGVEAMAWSAFLSMLISFIVTAVTSGRIIKYGLFEQLKDNLPNIILTATMALIVWCIGLINLDPGVILLLQVISGVVVYVGLSAIFRMSDFHYILDTVKDFLAKRKTK